MYYINSTQLRESRKRRVADGAKDARTEVRFSIGDDRYEVSRSLHDLSITTWKLNGAAQAADDGAYMSSIVRSMNVGTFADVLTIMNLILFMFEIVAC